jgi:hypothetical protein
VVEGQACGEQKDGCEPRMGGLVLCDAGHQTSLFSIRPPEVQHRASLEDSSTKRGTMPPQRRLMQRGYRCQRGRGRAFIRIGLCDHSALESELGTLRPIPDHVADRIRLSRNAYK